MVIVIKKDFTLRPIQISDAKGYFEAKSDMKALSGFMFTPKNVNEAEKDIKNKILVSRGKKPRGETFAIIVGGEFAGYIELHHLNEKYFEHIGQVGYCIHPNFRGKGLATKVLKVVVNYAIKKYNLKRLVGTCRSYNTASARVLEKVGFKLEGILRKNKFKDGKYLDDMVWAKIR